jgi:hypothetical protein
MMLRRFVLIASISGGVAGFALVSPALALPGGGHANDVYTGPGSAFWGGSHVDTPTVPITLANGNGETADLRGLVLDVSSSGKVTGGFALWAPQGVTVAESATFASGSVKNGKATADGTLGTTKFKITLAFPGLSATAVNSSSPTTGTGTITATVW